MKKLIKRITAMALSLASLSCMMNLSAFAADSYSMGDCNDDGAVDAVDASEILGYYAAKSTGTAMNWEQARIDAADVNDDGNVDAVDASEILSFYAYKATGGKNNIGKYLTILDSIKLPDTYVSLTAKDAGNGRQAKISWDMIDGVTGYIVTLYKVTSDQGYTTEKISEKRQANKNITTMTYDLPSDLQISDKVYYEFEIAPYKKIEDVVVDGKACGWGYLNTTELIFNRSAGQPHDDIEVYNIQGEKPYLAWTSYLTDRDKQILDQFAKDHFTADMTNYDKINCMAEWIYNNLTYATVGPLWDEIVNLSWVDAVLVHKKGQCIQYNGALAALAAYMGYDVYMVQGYYGKGQHFWALVKLDNGEEFTLDLGI